MGDGIDSTHMHINDLPIRIPLPIHERGLSFNIVYYLPTGEAWHFPSFRVSTSTSVIDQGRDMHGFTESLRTLS